MDYKHKDAFVENSYNTNIFIAIFTTANARLRLYEQLQKLGESVAYCDTDSIVYIDNGRNTVKTGDLLGEWTDELGKNVHIDKWLATGPKSYHYRTNTGKEVTKVKGFTLNYRNCAKINGKYMEQLIYGQSSGIMVKDKRILRDNRTKNLITKKAPKTLDFNFDKRIVTDTFDTYPYGYYNK